ncbi:hypothetical protein FOL47_004683 [Perkinsus chesapeaki]|uniref:mannose-6-phosphate isomerase n=1 Tax=Perkinsus chesapeaki TaxID=330153 RepID=A0A7J6M264_PERCH|nr:hypothetical protein FOL47_004683 [Perkinsus chesapeaki]
MSASSTLRVVEPAIQNYAWGKIGSSSKVALLAKEGDHTGSFKIDESKPYAELWMGDHPNGVCHMADGGETIQAWLATEEGKDFLGSVKQLPYLFKVLSIRLALSIQSHPDKALAQKLHHDRPDLYKDPNHKPEIAIALTNFVGMCGFRPVTEIAAFCNDFPELGRLLGADICKQLDEDADGALKNAYSTLMRADGKAVAETISEIVSRTPVVDNEAHSLAIELDRQFPGGDVGVLSVFFLNIVHMVPGQCLYLKANTPHAYVSGDIMECMACSDNVIRGGLTPKYKDVEVLLQSLVFESRPASILVPTHANCGVKCDANTYAPGDIDDFEVIKVDASGEGELVPSKQCMSMGIVISGKGTINGMPVSEGEVVAIHADSKISVVPASGTSMEVFIGTCGRNYTD